MIGVWGEQGNERAFCLESVIYTVEGETSEFLWVQTKWGFRKRYIPFWQGIWWELCLVAFLACTGLFFLAKADGFSVLLSTQIAMGCQWKRSGKRKWYLTWSSDFCIPQLTCIAHIWPLILRLGFPDLANKIENAMLNLNWQVNVMMLLVYPVPSLHFVCPSSRNLVRLWSTLEHGMAAPMLPFLTRHILSASSVSDAALNMTDTGFLT